MNDPGTFEVVWGRGKKAGFAVITVSFADNTSLTETFEVIRLKERERVVKLICADREGLVQDDVRAELERIAKAVAGLYEDEETGGAASSAGEGDTTVSARVVDIALERYRLGRTPRHEPFAVPFDGPRVMRGLSDTGPTSLKVELAREYWRQEHRAASSSSLTDALNVLKGMAMEEEPEVVHVRVGGHGAGVVLDLGRDDGSVAIVTPDGWEISSASPVLFRRTELIGPLPLPERGGSIEGLKDLINVSEDSFPLVIGFLVAALLPEIGHPIALLGGEKGTGKSFSLELIASVIDPGPAVRRTPPGNIEDWALGASGSWVVPVDNVSRIPEWWSDALCRTATGDGLIRRLLYTSEQLSVLSFRRAVLLSSIDAGVLRGDLGDRLLLIDCERRPKRWRKGESKLRRQFGEAHPGVLGALLDLLARVLEVLPGVEVPELERMAEFHRVLVAIDQVLGTTSARTYVGQRRRVAEEVADGDAVVEAVRALAVRDLEWSGTASEMLDRIAPTTPPKNWPKNPRGLSGRLRHASPVLAELGVEVTPPSDSNRAAGRSRDRIWSVRLAAGGDPTVRTVRPSEDGPGDHASADSGRTVGEDGRGSGPSAVVREDPVRAAVGATGQGREEEEEWTA